MNRIKSVLGEDLTSHPEGKDLKDMGDMFEKKLNLWSICDDWRKEVVELARKVDYNKSLFDVS